MAEVMKRSLFNRIIGVAKLDAATFEEIEHDETATIPALIIAALVGVSIFLPMALLLAAYEASPAYIGLAFFMQVAITVVALLVFTTVAYVVGGGLLKTDSTEVTWVELLRTLGFAGVPLMVAGWLAMVPVVNIVILGWFLTAVVVAVRQAADLTTGRAVVTALAGLGVMILIYFGSITFFWLTAPV
jgi:hypothetical protein